MLDYSETSENVYLTFNQHIELKNKKFEVLVHLTFKLNFLAVTELCRSTFDLESFSLLGALGKGKNLPVMSIVTS